LSPDPESAPAPATERRAPERGRPRLQAERLTAYFGTSSAIRDVTIDLRDREVTAIIGPSGCGKSTFLRCLNRLHETIPSARAEGVTSESLTNRPSAFETIFCATAITSPGWSVISARRSPPRMSTAMSSPG